MNINHFLYFRRQVNVFCLHMEGGIFLLLCLLALFFGNNARRNRENSLSAKELARKAKFKLIMTWSALVLVTLFLLVFTPALIYDISVAIDTHFDKDTYIGIVLWVVAVFTIYTIIKQLRNKN